MNIQLIRKLVMEDGYCIANLSIESYSFYPEIKIELHNGLETVTFESKYIDKTVFTLDKGEICELAGEKM